MSTSHENVVDFTPQARPQPVKHLTIPPAVKDYFLAKNIVYSALGFALFNLCFYLVSFSGYTALSVIFYLLLTVLAVTVLVLVVMTMLHKFQAGPKPPSSISALQLDPVVVGDVAQGITAEINVFMRRFAEWRSGTNVGQTVVAIFGLWIAAKVSQLFSLMTITYIAGLVAFIVPPVYAANKNTIDMHLRDLNTKLIALYTQLYEKIPPQFRQVVPNVPAGKAD